jgi:hypothetical protein
VRAPRLGWPIAVAGLFLICVQAACRRPEPAFTYRDVVLDYSDQQIELVAGLEVTQVFVPNHDNTCGVALMMSNNGGRARDCDVALHLRARGSAADIAEHLVPCVKVPDRDWVRFDFPPLVYTRGRRLVVSVQSPNGRAGESAMVLMASVPDIYPAGRLRLSEVVTPGALRFMTFHR